MTWILRLMVPKVKKEKRTTVNSILLQFVKWHGIFSIIETVLLTTTVMTLLTKHHDTTNIKPEHNSCITVSFCLLP